MKTKILSWPVPLRVFFVEVEPSQASVPLTGVRVVAVTVVPAGAWEVAVVAMDVITLFGLAIAIDVGIFGFDAPG